MMVEHLLIRTASYVLSKVNNSCDASFSLAKPRSILCDFTTYSTGDDDDDADDDDADDDDDDVEDDDVEDDDDKCPNNAKGRYISFGYFQ